MVFTINACNAEINRSKILKQKLKRNGNDQVVMDVKSFNYLTVDNELS